MCCKPLEFEKVAGGVSENEVGEKKNINLLGGHTEPAICKVCGREYEKLFLPMSMAMVGPDADRWRYYDGMCDECKKNHPYEDPMSKLLNNIKSQQSDK
ncbi:MAG: hypothetical protein Q4D57_06005 [Clostridia bacterium]|nr:hypothetical protein [Clostridia bacterium]